MAWPIKAKLHVEDPCEAGTKVYINDLGLMTKMAAMAIESKNLKKSSPEPEGLMILKLGMTHRGKEF